MSLFSQLGVEHPDSALVFDLIRKAYRSGRSISLISSVEHITYFFWKRPETRIHWPEGLVLYDKAGTSYSHSYNDFYFPTSDPFGVEELSRKRPVKVNGSKVLSPGHFVAILNSRYLGAVPDSAVSNGNKFKKFLNSELRIRTAPRLLEQVHPARLSEVFQYICDSRPEKVVGVLKKYWSEYKGQMSPEVIHLLQKINVPSSDGIWYSLDELFLPLPELTEVCDQLDISREFPFLSIPLELRQDALEEWEFLHILGVGKDLDLSFYLNVLETAHRQLYKSWGKNLDNMSRFKVIYQAIQDRCKKDDRSLVRYVEL